MLQNGAILRCKIKRDKKLKKLIEGYCKHKKLQTDQVSFFYKGSKVDQMHTPDELGMRDNDRIDITLSPVNVAAEETVGGVGLGEGVVNGHRIAVERRANTGGLLDEDDGAGDHGKSSRKKEEGQAS